MRLPFPILLVTIALAPLCAGGQNAPIIDVHLHAYPQTNPGMTAVWAADSEAKSFQSPPDADIHREKVFRAMDRQNIVLGIVSSTDLESIRMWSESGQGRLIGGIQTDDEGMPIVSVDSLELLAEEGTVGVLGELGLQYYGVRPDDERLEPYYAIAEKTGIPVCLHTGLGPPEGPHTFAPKFRTDLGRPSLFEPILVRHPDLKAFLAHAGWPYLTETIALMYIYTDLYVDIGVLTWALPKKVLYDTLKRLIDAGFEKRIMFGSDQMLWPGAIEMAVRTVKEVPFLTEQQKRDILYNNAARFLELPDSLVEQHHSENGR